MLLTAKDLRIGVRIRRKSNTKYAGQFTVRYSRSSGAKTEWAKLCSGLAHWLFYGFECGPGAVDPWCVVDVRQLVSMHAHRTREECRAFCGRKSNADGSSDFFWWDTQRTNWPGLLVARSPTWPT